jgi:hypothetical protein
MTEILNQTSVEVEAIRRKILQTPLSSRERRYKAMLPNTANAYETFSALLLHQNTYT